MVREHPEAGHFKTAMDKLGQGFAEMTLGK